jgi:hypothetical protein
MLYALQYVSDGIYYGRIKIDGKVIPAASMGCTCTVGYACPGRCHANLPVKE